MAHKDLQSFVDSLWQVGELREIALEVDPVLEISAIVDRVVKQDGPALLFTNVKGYPDFPVLINTFGSKRRMEMALGAEELDDIAAEIAELINPQVPAALAGKLQMLPALSRLKDLQCRKVRKGPGLMEIMGEIAHSERSSSSSIPRVSPSSTPGLAHNEL